MERHCARNVSVASRSYRLSNGSDFEEVHRLGTILVGKRPRQQINLF